MNNNINKGSDRRAFIASSLKTAAAAALVNIPFQGFAESHSTKREYTVQDVIDIILKEIPGAPFAETVDTIKSGSASNKVTGIVTTMFATIDVIKEAAKLNANFIIAHEPTFYNHTDDVNYVPNNSVLKKKQELLKEHNITVWRFHDYWHSARPDGIRYGVLKSAGWLKYFDQGKNTMTIPSQSLKELAEHLKRSLKIDHVRMIGKLEQSCQKIVLMPGAAGGQPQISIVEKEQPDVLIVGEVHEWETAEYIRDLQELGGKTSLIVLSHSLSEEPGMEWLVDWLNPKTPELNIVHVASGSPFVWI